MKKEELIFRLAARCEAAGRPNNEDNYQVDENLTDDRWGFTADKEISLGYHGHNNFQMGYANCIAMLEYNTDRPMLVDGTLYGMGKSAGNAPIELVAMHMNQKYGKHYHISQMLEAIDSNIMQFYQPSTWGYNLFFYLAASNDCHPNYVAFLMNKKTL